MWSHKSREKFRIINSIKFNTNQRIDVSIKLSNKVIGCSGKNSFCRVVRVEAKLYNEGMRGKKAGIV